MACSSNFYCLCMFTVIYLYCLSVVRGVVGMLLRLFERLYDMEIIEEQAFIKWKEQVSDEYPGKGKALFQVRTCSRSWSRVLKLKSVW
jgi:hypothetical protein